MVVVRGRIIFRLVQRGKFAPARGVVALGADGIALGHQRVRMRLMAIGAGDALGLHLGLQEGPENEHLGILLAVAEIEVGCQQRKRIVIVEG